MLCQQAGGKKIEENNKRVLPLQTLAPPLEVPGASPLKVPGDKIWDQNDQVQVF